ncbi:MAG TPA: dUTP diphosphatase [Planococcus sp. (in: firmicutes)]|nr:dUTP diphosphatase [Planococcus sp. (in: firmicutes)]
MDDYQKVWSWYGALAVALDFSYDEVLGAYVKKNEENYERQREGY